MYAHWRRCFGGALLAVASLPLSAQQTPTAPSLTRSQRAAMQALVRAVDAGTAEVTIPDGDWPLHVLRASDGSHYVAFSLNQTEGMAVGRPTILYVRLASRPAGPHAPVLERSAVAEWLAGQTPAPLLPRRGIAFGEMPTYGAAGIGQRSAGLQAQNLQILEMERRRAREKQEDQERARRAALEGQETARPARPWLPFEDFDLNAVPVADSSGAAVLRRSFTAGPGHYELSVAWAEPGDTTVVRMARRSVTLPPASSAALALSSVIVADDVTIRETAVPPTEQSAHPYSIGATEIVPARDHLLTSEERLALVVQVINARGSAMGKPDLEVGFRLFRRTGDREENIGALAPQSYNQLTLPVDFDTAKGHPIFAAVAVPLATFKRGDYRMEIAAHDRLAGAGVSTDVTFTIVATPAALLREAPPLVSRFDPSREHVPTTVSVMVGAIRASEGNDREAISAWQTAINGGADPLVVWPLMIDASLRLGDALQALSLATKGLAASPNHARLTRQLATAHLAAGHHAEALRIVDESLQREPRDLEALWLAIRALFTSYVAGEGPGTTPQGRDRLSTLVEQYAADNGPHAALARDWANAAR